MPANGLILFAHGARDPRWAEPFESLAGRLRKAVPDQAVELAYLELMQPDLDEAVVALLACGCTRIRVVPVFLGQGGHVRRDLPALVDAIRSRRPGLHLDVMPSIGEDPAVLDAIAAYCLRVT